MTEADPFQFKSCVVPRDAQRPFSPYQKLHRLLVFCSPLQHEVLALHHRCYRSNMLRFCSGYYQK
jgi:hypothetical protein